MNEEARRLKMTVLMTSYILLAFTLRVHAMLRSLRITLHVLRDLHIPSHLWASGASLMFIMIIMY